MTEQDKEDFFQSKRIFAEAMVNLLESHGRESVRKNLGELFADQTLKLFPTKFTKENLYKTIIDMKRDELVYRDDSLNNLRK